MAEDFLDLKSGDAITPRHFNAIYRELRRWRKLRGDGVVNVSGADGAAPPVLSCVVQPVQFLRLTGPASGGCYPWEEVTIASGRVVATTGVTGSATNNPAWEVQSGDTTLTADGTVYEFVSSPAAGEGVFFDGKN